MEKKEKILLGIVFVLGFLGAIFMDITGGNLQADGTIERDYLGGDGKRISLQLDAEGLFENYEYELDLEPMRVSWESANMYFEETIDQIDEDFREVEERLPIQEEYQDGLVYVWWSFSPYGFVGEDGSLLWENIPPEGIIISATVEMSCGEYEMTYSFPVELKQRELSEEEQLLQGVEEWVETQMSLEEEASFQLPLEINGVRLIWTEEKEYLSIKILCLELAAIICICIAKRKQHKNEVKLRRNKLEEDFPDIVSQLVVLLGAGMTVRQAWSRIAYQYEDKKSKCLVEKKEVYEEIEFMVRRIREGEKEKKAYEDFVERIGNVSYRRLMRLLLNNLEKGTKDLRELLEEECRQAFAQRIITAKIRGEEASTRMLMPLMLMMLLVMFIVLLPAMISFTI